MTDEQKRTYVPYKDFPEKSRQTEYTKSTPLLFEDGTLAAKGWARKNYFDFDPKKLPKRWRKEWEFYLIDNKNFMALMSVVKTAIGGYVNVALMDVKNGGFKESATVWFFKNKPALTVKGDAPGGYSFSKKDAVFEVKNTEKSRELYFKKGGIECRFQMDLFENHENITTVIPFKDDPKKFFLTTKQNCMPCEGSFVGDKNSCVFHKDDAFCCMDWGRIAAPRSVVWYWGNGSAYLFDENGERHVFGFELTWGIGDESHATETCLFYDGKAHKIGAVDVEIFPKPDKFMQPWHVVSEDMRFDMTMIPDCDSHTDTKIGGLLRMHGHQVFGTWSGTATLDDGTLLKIENMHAFCEYVENKW